MNDQPGIVHDEDVSSRTGLRLPAVILGLGLTSSLLLLAVNHITGSLVRRDGDRARAVATVRTALATAHLWLEEHVSGDEVDLDALRGSLERAVRETRRLLEGDEAADLPPLASPELRRRTSELEKYVGAFHDISIQRLEGLQRGDDVGIGSSVDATYDAVFDDAFVQAQALETLLENRLGRHRSLARRLLVLILVAWAAIVLLAAFGLWSREERRRRALEALRDRDRRLLQAQKLEAVGKMAAGLAHDLNNVLAAARSNADAARRAASEDPEMDRRMQRILEAVDRAALLIRRLPTLRLGHGGDPELLEVNEVIRRARESVLEPLLGDGVRLELDLEPSLPAVYVDRSHLEQIVLNLVVNADQAMTQGGRVRLTTRESPFHGDRSELTFGDPPGPCVVLEVRDDGPGIPEEIIDRIFDPYFSTKGETNSGLGLATVFALVRRAEGGLRVENLAEGGASFRIFLPCLSVPLESATARPSGEVEGVDRSDGEIRVLLVEDDEELRGDLALTLDEEGFQVEVARDGSQAFRRWKDRIGEIDLLVTDLVMPELDGRRLLESLRALRPDLAALIITGDPARLEDAELVDTITGLLPKPFSREELLVQIRRLLGRGAAV